MVLSRPGFSGRDEPGFEAIRGQESKTADSLHPAIFWHFYGNACMSCGALQKLQRLSRYIKRTVTEQIFCRDQEKGSKDQYSRFEPKISLILFSRSSDPISWRLYSRPKSTWQKTGKRHTYPGNRTQTLRGCGFGRNTAIFRLVFASLGISFHIDY